MQNPAMSSKLPGSPVRSPPGRSGSSGSFRECGDTARRLNSALPTLRRSPDQLRSLLVHAKDLQEEISQLEPKPSLTGRWKKCKESSDPMDDACDMVALSWVLRKAIGVLNYLEVDDTPNRFVTNLKAGGIMDVIEKYPWTGDKVTHPRRDKRRGTHTAFVTRSADGHPCIVATWGEPYAGQCSDTFELSEDGGTLTQHTDMTIHSSGRRTQYRTVFKRVHSQ